MRRGLLRELWDGYWALGYYERRLTNAGIALVLGMFFVFPLFMCVFVGFSVAIALCLRWHYAKNRVGASIWKH